MAPELSSNWKKLQAEIAAESPTEPLAESSTKRKISDESPRRAKKLRTERPLQPRLEGRPSTERATRGTDMGAGQSSRVAHGSAADSGPAPLASLSLWAEGEGVSAEDLAEAYGLGIKKNAMLDASDRINSGLSANVELGKYVAIDCEMVGVGDGGYESALARLSFVDYHGNQVYDSYVRPCERVVDWRTPISGISPKHMKLARDFDEVQREAAEILQGRILVGHDVRHDLNALQLSHPASKIRDTSSYSGFRKYGNGRKPALRRLAQEILEVEIQAGAHSSIEDARVAMLLFRKFKSGFDTEYGNRFPAPSSNGSASSKANKKTKKSKKNRKS
jgi:RNA exonuclease 4